MIRNKLENLTIQNSSDAKGFLESDDVLFQKDNTIESLGLFLKDRLNQMYRDSASKYGYSIGDTLVRTVKFYDAFSIQNTDFPLLKVYRVSTNFNHRSPSNNNTININYSLVLPEQERLQPLLHGISKAINYSLLSPTSPLKIERGLTFQYRTLISERSQPTYSFLTTSINIKE